MKNRNIGLSIFLLIVILAGCTGNKFSSVSEKEKKQVDSIVYANRNLNSLNLLLEKFQSEKNNYGVVVTYRELGKLYRKDGDFIKAIEQHQLQAKLAQEIGDTLDLVQALNNIGTNYRRMGVLEEASSFHFQALGFCEKYSDKKSKTAKKNRVVSLNGIGNIYLTLNNREAADSIFRLALHGEQELGSHLGQAINYANIGSLFEMDNEIDSARYYYNKSMEANVLAKSKVGLSLCHTYFGRLHENEKQWDKAIAEYKKAYDIMVNDVDSWHWMESCLALSRVNLKKGNLVEANNYLKKAEQTARELNSLEHMAEVHRLYYLWEIQKGDHKMALEHYIKSVALSDSVANDQNMNHIQNLRIQYERAQKQNQIDLLTQNYQMERSYKNLFLMLAVIIFLFAILIITFLWYMNRMRGKNQKMLQKVEKMRTNFFTNITHEFRTPLTVILGFSEQMEKGQIPENDTIQNVGRMISRQGRSLLSLINQLLDISKIKSNIGNPEWLRGNIVPYIHMICNNYQQAAQQKRIDLVYSSKMSSIEMEFVPDYVQKVLRNLLSNALKFTPEYGQIFVTTSVENEHLKLMVSDNGRGIEPGELPHIFDAFYQGDNSRTEIGTGVGLSLVKQIIDAISGKIDVKSTLNKGTVFIIIVPLHYPKLTNVKPLEESILAVDNFIPVDENVEIAELPKGSGDLEVSPIVLIVEDNQDVLYYIGSQLQDQYRLYYARNGEEGLNKANELMPDIIVTDLMMPEMDGYELCRQIRSSEILNHIPIIIITAKSTESDRIKGIDAGADAYLYKPFNSEELNVRVKHLLNSRKLLRQKYSTALQEGAEDTVQLSNSDQMFLNKLVDVAYAMMSSCSIEIDTLASKMCMSPKQLNRKILAITGENTTAYLIQIRLSKAKRLLDSPENIPIGDIAMQCGFEDSAYFSRIFKKMFNLTPSQYKKRVK